MLCVFQSLIMCFCLFFLYSLVCSLLLLFSIMIIIIVIQQQKKVIHHVLREPYFSLSHFYFSYLSIQRVVSTYFSSQYFFFCCCVLFINLFSLNTVEMVSSKQSDCYHMQEGENRANTYEKKIPCRNFLLYSVSFSLHVFLLV